MFVTSCLLSCALNGVFLKRKELAPREQTLFFQSGPLLTEEAKSFLSDHIHGKGILPP